MLNTERIIRYGIVIPMMTMMLTACSSYSMRKSDTTLASLSGMNIRAPLKADFAIEKSTFKKGRGIEYDTGFDWANSQVKNALTGSQVFIEDSNSSYKLLISTKLVARKDDLPALALSLLSLGLLTPIVIDLEYKTTVKVSKNSETIKVYQYKTTVSEYTSLYPTALLYGDTEYKASRRYGSIISTNLIKDMNTDGLL